MASTVYCIARSEAQASRIGNRLLHAGYASDDISILYPDPVGVRELPHECSTKAPEAAMTGAGAGAVIGGAIGWSAGIGSLAIPGVGPLIAAGPVLAALSGLAVGGTLGGLLGTLIGLGIPEHEAQQYEGRLREGNILIFVHALDEAEAARIRKLFRQEHADDVSTGKETPVHAGMKP